MKVSLCIGDHLITAEAFSRFSLVICIVDTAQNPVSGPSDTVIHHRNHHKSVGLLLSMPCAYVLLALLAVCNVSAPRQRIASCCCRSICLLYAVVSGYGILVYCALRHGLSDPVCK